MANFPAQVLQPDGAERRARDVDMVIVGAGIISGTGDLHLASNGGVVVIDTGVQVESASGTDAFIEGAGGSTVAVSPAGRGRFRYNETTNKWQLSENGAAYVDLGTGSVAIGAPVTGGAPNAVLFVDAGGNLGQDAAGYLYDDVDDTIVLAGGVLIVDSAVPVSGVGSIRLRSSGGSFQVSEGGGIYRDVLVTGDNTLQASYDASTGAPVNITLAVARGGVHILSAAGVTTPAFAVNDNNTANATLSIARTPGVATAGSGVDVSMGASTTGRAVNIVQAGTGDGINITITVAGAVASRGISVTVPVAHTGAGVEVSSAGTAPAILGGTIGGGVGVSASGTSTGTALSVLATGTGVAANINQTGTERALNITKTPGVAAATAAVEITMSAGAGNSGIGINLSMAAGTTGNGYSVAMTGTGRPIQITHSAGAGSSIRLDRAPAVVTAGAGLDIIYNLNTTGIPILVSNAGTGGGINLSNTGSGTTIGVTASGSGAVATWTHSGTNAGPFTYNNSSNTSGISANWTRLPTVATGGTIFRINGNANFTGINLELLAVGPSQGIDMVVGSTGLGVVLHDQAGTIHTNLLLRLQHDQTGSTGLLLEMRKLPGAATAGDLASILTSASASGHVWAVTHAGSGDYESIAMTGAGRYLTLSHTVAGEVWRITGPAALVTCVLTTAGAMQLAAGTAGAPSFTFTLSPTTGFFRSAADVVDLSIAGTSKYSFAAATLTFADAVNIAVGTTTGTKIGTAATQKLSVYGVAPVAQGAAIADAAGGVVIDAEARTALNALLARERAFGQIAP